MITITQRIKHYNDYRGLRGLELQVKTPSGEWLDKDYLNIEATEYEETYSATLETPPEYEASAWEDEDDFYERALAEWNMHRTDYPYTDGTEYTYTLDTQYGIIYKVNEDGEIVEELDTEEVEYEE